MQLIAEIDDYSRKTGLKPTTICQNAFGNARLYDRLRARITRVGDEAAKLRAYIAANPPPKPQEAAE